MGAEAPSQEAPQEAPQAEKAPEAAAQEAARAEETKAQIEVLKTEGQAAEDAAGAEMTSLVEEMKAGNLDTSSKPDVVVEVTQGQAEASSPTRQAEEALNAAGISTEDLATGKVGFLKRLMNRKAIKAWEEASAQQYDSMDKSAEVSAKAKTRGGGSSNSGGGTPMGLS